MRIVRNTLARRALEGTQFACMQQELVGPLLLAFPRIIRVPLRVN